jgi:hypothetical protein
MFYALLKPGDSRSNATHPTSQESLGTEDSRNHCRGPSKYLSYRFFASSKVVETDLLLDGNPWAFVVGYAFLTLRSRRFQEFAGKEDLLFVIS